MGLIKWRHSHEQMVAFIRIKREIVEFSLDPADLLIEILKFDDKEEIRCEMEDLNDGLDSFQRIASKTIPNWWDYEP